MGIPEKIKAVQDEIGRTQLNKATEHHIGILKAKITVSQLLSLKTSAKLNGDITTNKLSIEPGAEFTGSCRMGAVIKDIKRVEKQEKQEKTA